MFVDEAIVLHLRCIDLPTHPRPTNQPRFLSHYLSARWHHAVSENQYRHPTSGSLSWR